jgi:cytochrome c oxidase assembly factor CtaG
MSASLRLSAGARLRAGGVALAGLITSCVLSPAVVHAATTSHVVFMAQIEALTVLAPVLLVLSLRPGWLGGFWSDAYSELAPYAAAVFAAVLVLWHLPALHDQVMTSSVLQGLRVVSLGLAGLLLWLGALGDSAQGSGKRRTLSLLAAQEASGLVGLVLLLSPHLLFGGHSGGSFGLSPLEDQRWAGLLMLVVDVAVTLPLIGRLLSPSLLLSRPRRAVAPSVVRIS